MNSVPFFKICVGSFFWCSFRQIQWRCRLYSSKKGNWWNITLGLNRSCKLKDDINVILQLEKLQAERQYVGLQTSFKLRELFTILTKRDLDKLEESALQRILTDAVCMSAAQSAKKVCQRCCQELGLGRMNITICCNWKWNFSRITFMLSKGWLNKINMLNQKLYNWFNDKMEEDKDWIDKVWFGDEAHCHFGGYANSKNWIFWRSKPTQNFCSSLYRVQRLQLFVQ